MKNQSFLKRFAYALAGIRVAIEKEKSFRTQLIAAILVFVALAWLGASPVWWAIIALCVSLVLTAELFNTALEQFIDHMHPGQHIAVGIAKDCAAGAVLISSVFSVLVFIAYLIDRFYFL